MISSIIFDILLPIFVMISLGSLLKWKFDVDLGTLSKLNLYLFVPAFVFDKVSTSKLPWEGMLGIVGVTALQVVALGVIVFGLGKLFRVGQQTLAAVALGVMFYNSGNFGLPLAELAYPQELAEHTGKNGAAVQAFVLLTINVLTFTVGLTIAAWAGTGSVGQGIIKVLKMPVLPTLAAAIVARWYCDGDETRLPVVIRKPAEYLSDGLVSIALVTLGVQLAANPRWPRWKPVLAVMGLRLIVAPVLMGLMLLGFHKLEWKVLDLWPWPAEMLILTAASPSAVNTLLLTLELDGDTDLAADTVFWTTIGCCGTVLMWLVVVKSFWS
jgi:predicted permease